MEALFSYISLLPYLLFIIIVISKKNIPVALCSALFLACFFTSHIFIIKGFSINTLLALLTIYWLFKKKAFGTIKGNNIQTGYFKTVLFAIILFVSNVCFCSVVTFDIKKAVLTTLSNLAPFIVAWGIVNFLNVKRDISFVLNVIMATAVIVSVYSIYCYFLGFNPFTIYVQTVLSTVEDYSESARGALIGRVQGFMSHPLHFAGTLLCTIFVTHTLYIRAQNRKTKILVACIILLLFVTLVLTGSRSGVVGCVIGMGMFYSLLLGKKLPLFLFFCLIFVYLFGLDSYINEDKSSFTYAVIHFWEQNDDMGGSSVDLRIQQFKGTVDMVFTDLLTMLFGKGTNWCFMYSLKNGAHPVLAGFESVFIKWPIEYGIIGSFLFFYIIFIRPFLSVNSRCFDKHARYLLACSLLSFFIFVAITGHYAIDMFVVTFALMIQALRKSEFA